MIIGSGNVVDYLPIRKWDEGTTPYDWAVRFDDAVRDCLAGHDHDRLLDLEAMGEAAALSVPTPDHYLPLLYVVGFRGATDKAAFVVDGIERGSVGMLTVAIGL